MAGSSRAGLPKCLFSCVDWILGTTQENNEKNTPKVNVNFAKIGEKKEETKFDVH